MDLYNKFSYNIEYKYDLKQKKLYTKDDFYMYEL